MTLRKKTATTIAALAAIGALGIAGAGPAAAGDNYGTAVPASAETTTAGDNWGAYAPTAGPAKSWGPYTTAAALKRAFNDCTDTGAAGVKAKKWKSFTCEISNGGKAGDYVGLWVKI
ncbi:hypothetical protein ACWGCP_28515 [Streptomyces niveus]